jgi:hypothetical protein
MGEQRMLGPVDAEREIGDLGSEHGSMIEMIAGHHGGILHFDIIERRGDNVKSASAEASVRRERGSNVGSDGERSNSSVVCFDNAMLR